jgi:hypothetical protein
MEFEFPVIAALTVNEPVGAGVAVGLGFGVALGLGLLRVTVN